MLRRDLLLERLDTFCERCGSTDLPVPILAVYGFGSFFRGVKPNPRDVDLVVVVDFYNPHPRFAEFLSLRKGRLYGLDEHATPSDTLLATHPLFSQWLKGVSWKTLYPSTYYGLSNMESPSHFAGRLLKASLPGLSIQFLPGPEHLVTKLIRKIWTPDSRDVRSMVKQLWHTGFKRDELFQEVVSLASQQHPCLWQIELYRSLIKKVASTRKRFKAWDDYYKWEQGIDPRQKLDRLQSHPNETIPLPSNYHISDFSDMSVSLLSMALERQRQKLLSLRHRVEVLSSLLHTARLWVMSDRTVPVKDFLGWHAGVSKRLVSESIAEGMLVEELEELKK